MGRPEKKEHHSTCCGKDSIECLCGAFDYNKSLDDMNEYLPSEEEMFKLMCSSWFKSKGQDREERFSDVAKSLHKRITT